MEYKERYKEVFSQIQPMREFDLEELYMKKPNRNITKKIVCVAAVIAVLTSLCFTAYAANLFGLRDLLLPQKQEVQLPLNPDDTTQGEISPDRVQDSYVADVISLAGFANTQEAKATAEWQAFLNSYDPGPLDNSIFGAGTDYVYYQVYDQTMADKLDEIIAKYDLKLHNSMVDDLYTDEALCDQVGGDFLGENRAYSTYMYEDGTFKFDGELDLEGYGLLDYQFQRCVRGSFTDILLNIGDVNDYTEWVYATQDGTAVTLALSAYKAVIIADLPDSFVTINVLAGTETQHGGSFSSGLFDAADLERFADSFDFSFLTPARPADPDLPRPTLDEVLGKPTPEEFSLIAGLEEAEAQSFYAEFFQAVETGERELVASKILYPTLLTRWQTSGSGTYLVETVVESAEEFLLYYNDIFTESLWDSISQNQYTMDRADLIPDNGMVGAAAGSLWFAGTPEGIKIFTIQNAEGCGIRQHKPSSSIALIPVAETRYDSAWTAYAAVLNTLLYERVFPDGTPYDPFVDGTGDMFTLADVNGDGAEELILLATNSYTAGQAGYVLSWDEKTGTTRIELLEHPAFAFYDNGYLQAFAAHNQGMAGNALWPYTLYQYDKATRTYRAVATVDAWDSAMGDHYYDMFFPTDADRSNTGVVYYVMEPDNYDLSAPMDATDYIAWQDSWQAGVKALEFPYQELTAENIASLKEIL